ncbi:hypothetical protein CROQUDRAFT_655124 [Cronartium quercuum f. sp. fusiforme G11]|uniref:Uncharacterized protein n=1 Tax=Cronartium quercuum f. sp. fusiforme G11 TaxID=708437 RepID=A0A9P6NRE6_9BASI|nr:hypothetical protein CROQUDRAFT_655124 [Cronartium quercuum f. sp. fusiforme G11]
MSPNCNASTSKTLNQARNLTYPYLQAQGQSATPSPYAHIQAPGVIRNEDKGMSLRLLIKKYPILVNNTLYLDHLDPRCLSSAKLTFMFHIEVHLPNGEDENDDEETVQKNSKKTPKASKEAKGNYTACKNNYSWEVSITVNKDMNISQFQSLIFSGCDKHYQDISEGLKKALFQGELQCTGWIQSQKGFQKKKMTLK